VKKKKQRRSDIASSFFFAFPSMAPEDIFFGSSEEFLMIWNSSLPQNSNLQT